MCKSEIFAEILNIVGKETEVSTRKNTNKMIAIYLQNIRKSLENEL